MTSKATMKVLLTGFAPFDKDPINSSWEVARSLNGVIIKAAPPTLPSGRPSTRKPAASKGVAVTQALVVARQLPCEFDRSREVLARLIKRLEPNLVVGLGQANSRNDISVERVAININDARIADNAGAKPIDTAVIADAPVGYFSHLPIKAIVQAMRHAGIPASVSQTAGTYVSTVIYSRAHAPAGHPLSGQARRLHSLAALARAGRAAVPGHAQFGPGFDGAGRPHRDCDFVERAPRSPHQRRCCRLGSDQN